MKEKKKRKRLTQYSGTCDKQLITQNTNKSGLPRQVAFDHSYGLQTPVNLSFPVVVYGLCLVNLSSTAVFNDTVECVLHSCGLWLLAPQLFYDTGECVLHSCGLRFLASKVVLHSCGLWLLAGKICPPQLCFMTLVNVPSTAVVYGYRLANLSSTAVFYDTGECALNSCGLWLQAGKLVLHSCVL